MKVIGVTGLPGSGKGLIFDKAQEKGAIVVNMGDRIREVAAERGADVGVTARKLREEQGQYIVAKLTIKKIQELLEEKTDAKIILIDGIRSAYEVELFENSFDDFVSIAIFASPKLRFERLQLRNREDDSSDYEDFKERDQRELEFGIGTVIATSDYLIKNETSLEDYEKEIEDLLNELIN
ncbi:MAG: flagellar hook-basal body complex protein FliE [archaeon]|nr:flagellar hook-basal body complex protein FliE [archaeon]